MNYTPKQLMIMNFIRDYRRRNHTSPTLEEIGNSLGVHRVAAAQHIAALVKMGAIQRLPQRSRSIEILDREYLPEPTVPVPGPIAAGRPIEAIEDADPIALKELLPIRPEGDSYVLRVVGEGMVEAHINDGDLVMVERGATARDGEIVVAVVDGEATLTRYYREADGSVRLQPANSSMGAIHVQPSMQLEIRGVVRGVLRGY